ncbi:MAG: hypothetical protein AMXMBFR84_05500 [Candidatus Hydrogenedentota bacterium]
MKPRKQNRDYRTMKMIRIGAVFCAAVSILSAWAEPLPERPIDAILEDAKSYEFGNDRTALSELEQAVFASAGDAEASAELAGKLAKYLSDDVSLETKRFVVRQLRLIGTEDTVPALKALLKDDELCHLATYALGSIEGDKATDALTWGLGKARAQDKAGIASVLGARGSDKAVAGLRKALKNNDLEVKRAVASALGTIGGAKAMAVLLEAHKKAQGDARKTIEDGLITGAKGLLASGETAEADGIYSVLYEGSEAAGVKSAALTGIANTRGAEALPVLAAAIDSGDAYMVQVALDALQSIDGPGITGALMERMGKFGPDADVLILKTLALRGDVAARGTAVAAAANPDARVRMAGLDALSALGDASSLGVLLDGLVKGERMEQEAARFTLSVLPGDNVNRGLIDTINAATDTRIRAEAIRALGSRDAQEAIPMLFQLGSTKDADGRGVALDTLGVLCGADHLQDLIDLLVKVNGQDVQANAEKAVVEVATKIPMDQEPAKALVAALASAGAKATELSASLLSVIGRVGDASALDEVRAAAGGDSKPVQRAAVQALTEWPTPDTVADLASIAETSKEDDLKATALQGLLQQLRVASTRSADDTLALYQRAIALAGTADNRKAILAGLGNIPDAKALALIEPFMNDPEVKNEAHQAAEKVRAATKPQ